MVTRTKSGRRATRASYVSKIADIQEADHVTTLADNHEIGSSIDACVPHSSVRIKFEDFVREKLFDTVFPSCVRGPEVY